jgi:hypothetical protein
MTAHVTLPSIAGLEQDFFCSVTKSGADLSDRIPVASSTCICKLTWPSLVI